MRNGHQPSVEKPRFSHVGGCARSPETRIAEADLWALVLVVAFELLLEMSAPILMPDTSLDAASHPWRGRWVLGLWLALTSLVVLRRFAQDRVVRRAAEERLRARWRRDLRRRAVVRAHQVTSVEVSRIEHLSTTGRFGAGVTVWLVVAAATRLDGPAARIAVAVLIATLLTRAVHRGHRLRWMHSESAGVVSACMTKMTALRAIGAERFAFRLLWGRFSQDWRRASKFSRIDMVWSGSAAAAGLGAGFALALSLTPVAVAVAAAALLSLGVAIAAVDLVRLRAREDGVPQTDAGSGRRPPQELTAPRGQVVLVIAADPVQRRAAVEDLLALDDRQPPRAPDDAGAGGRILVPSRPILLPGTLRDNLRLSAPDASDVRLAAALAASQAPGADKRLCDRLDLALQPPGVALAPSDLRALSFARALARSPRLVVVEALEAEEAEISVSERRHFDRLARTLAHHCSVILIASARPADCGVPPESTITLAVGASSLRVRPPAFEEPGRPGGR